MADLFFSMERGYTRAIGLTMCRSWAYAVRASAVMIESAALNMQIGPLTLAVTFVDL